MFKFKKPRLKQRPKAKPVHLVHEVMLGQEMVTVNITLTRRKSLAILVYPNMQVAIKAPLRTDVTKLLERLKAKEDWVNKHREKFRNLPHLSVVKKFVSGEKFSYLGKEYELRLYKDKNPRVELKGKFFDVYTRTASSTSVKTILRFWYVERAKELFTERMPLCLEATTLLKLPKLRTLDVKLMRGRWGSCASGRRITLNPELIAAPVECIDYVIVHELCHLREHNHSPRFYKLMDIAMPDWKMRRVHLNKTVEVRFL